MGKGDTSAQDSWEVHNDSQSFDDPLLGCLVLLTKLQHRPFSADALRAGLPLVDNRLTPDLFERAAERAGLSSRIVRRSLEEISELVLPAILLLNDGQACVLVALNKTAGTATVLQPEAGTGEHATTLEALKEQYTGLAIFVRPEHQFDERTPEVMKLKSRHWFWGTLFRSWRIYRDVLAASMMVNIFALASPLFIMNVYDRVVPNNAKETLWVLAIGVVIVFLFDFLMRTLRGFFIDVAGKKTDIALSAMILEKVLGLRMEVRPASVGAFANNLREFDSIRDFITSATITVLIDLPFVLLFLAVIALIGGPLVFVPLLGIPLVLIYGFAIQPALRHAVDHIFRASAQKNAILIESLTGIETIKTLGAESPIQRKWEHLVGYIARFGVRSRLLSTSAVNMATFVQQLAMVGIVIYGVYLITDGDLSMGGLIACVILTGRAMAPMAQVANLAVNYHQASAALKSLDAVMDLPVERGREKSFVRRPKFEGAIEFQNVNFSYPGQDILALKNISFKIKPGERVAIIGRIGSGKTTIEKLILGLYEPTNGSVHIDDIDVRQIDPADLRRSVGYVAQDIVLFYGTIRENIMYGAPFADERNMLQAAEIAGVSEFVNRHPKGFDMPIGERGEGLSGGQRQSVAIARSLLLDPPVLLMDEPSNAMDQSTEQKFKQKLTDHIADKTMIIVTHRASLLALVDRLIVMDNGQLVADGPKEHVLEALKQGKLHSARNK